MPKRKISQEPSPNGSGNDSVEKQNPDSEVGADDAESDDEEGEEGAPSTKKPRKARQVTVAYKSAVDKKGPITYYEECTIRSARHSLRLKLNDTVLVKGAAQDDGTGEPWIALIRRIYKEQKDDMLEVYWYYHFRQTEAGKKPNAKPESNDLNEFYEGFTKGKPFTELIPTRSVDGRCFVFKHTYYIKWLSQEYPEIKDEKVYWCGHQYHADKDEFVKGTKFPNYALPPTVQKALKLKREAEDQVDPAIQNDEDFDPSNPDQLEHEPKVIDLPGPEYVTVRAPKKPDHQYTGGFQAVLPTLHRDTVACLTSLAAFLSGKGLKLSELRELLGEAIKDGVLAPHIQADMKAIHEDSSRIQQLQYFLKGRLSHTVGPSTDPDQSQANVDRFVELAKPKVSGASTPSTGAGAGTTKSQPASAVTPATDQSGERLQNRSAPTNGHTIQIKTEPSSATATPIDQKPPAKLSTVKSPSAATANQPMASLHPADQSRPTANATTAPDFMSSLLGGLKDISTTIKGPTA
mmetsp:Transcript_15663/g.27073  ORF Transcript_15663/g.27073 Transcript_15663/m.27073 type:complete len:520 (-) Transcript_15663:101-1660(-)